MALNPSSIPTLAALAVNAGLALYVLRHGPRRPAHRAFALLLGALAAHATATVVLKNAPSPGAAEAAVRFQSVLLAATAPAFVHFAHVFPKGEPPGPLRLLLIYGALAPLAVASFAGQGPVQVIETPLGPTSRFLDKPVAYYYPLLGVFLLLALYGLFRVYRSYRDGGVVERGQIRWVVAGMLLGLAGGGVFKVALPILAGVDIPGSGSASATLPALFTAYAIVRHRFLAIEPVVERKLETRPRFALEPGLPLLAPPDLGRAAFIDLVDHGVSGLVISRTHPARLRQEMGLERTPAVWLSGEAVGEVATVERPEEVLRTIRHFLSRVGELDPRSRGAGGGGMRGRLAVPLSPPEGREEAQGARGEGGEAPLHPRPPAAVLLDGFEYLTTRFGFEATFRLVQDLRDLAEARRAVLLLAVELQGLVERERALLLRECRTMERMKEEG